MKTALLITFLVSSALAYIPNSEFIFLKTVKHHGSGDYRIEQEVSFPIGNDQKVIRETWYTRNGDDYYLLAKGRGFHLERLYKGGKVYTKDSNGQIKQLPWPKEFTEPWFLTTSTKDFKTLMRGAGVVTPGALGWDPVKQLKEVTTEAQMPVRLTRNQGIVMYAYGEPTPKDSPELNPTLWIEQDKFVVRRIRFNTKTEVVAEEFGEYSSNLSFPKTRVVNWDEKSVPLRVVQITSLGRGSGRANQVLSYDSFAKNEENKTVVEETLVNDIIRDFYTRFR